MNSLIIIEWVVEETGEIITSLFDIPAFTKFMLDDKPYDIILSRKTLLIN